MTNEEARTARGERVNDDDLQIAAARYTLSLLKSWDLPPIADAALNRGIYSPALAQLAAVDDPRMSDVGPLFETALAEVSAGKPSVDGAVWTLLRHYIRQIAEAEIPAREGLRRIMNDVYYPADLYTKSNACAGDSHDVNAFVGSFYEYDDFAGPCSEASFNGLYGEDAMRALDKDVIRLAKEWLATRRA